MKPNHDQHLQIIQEWKAGRLPIDLAQQYNTSICQILRIIRPHQPIIRMPRPVRPIPYLIPVSQSLDQGKTVAQLATELGISKEAVYDTLRRGHLLSPTQRRTKAKLAKLAEANLQACRNIPTRSPNPPPRLYDLMKPERL